MTIIQTLILSVIEGVTEFLPISSTGHLIIATHLLNIAESEFIKSFEVIIQLGAILAVVLLYFNYLLANKNIWPKIIVAFIPTGIVGAVLYQTIKASLLGNVLVTVLALLVGGFILLAFEKFFIKKISRAKQLAQLSYIDCLVIGTVQAVSVVPGVSRAAATIIGGLVRGLSREDAVKFSFLLAIPTMAAAAGYDLLKSGLAFSSDEYTLLAIGFVGAFASAYVVAKYFVKFIQTHTFTPFAWYRIVFALLYLGIFVKP